MRSKRGSRGTYKFHVNYLLLSSSDHEGDVARQRATEDVEVLLNLDGFLAVPNSSESRKWLVVVESGCTVCSG